MDPPVDEDDYLDFFANPGAYLGAIDDDDVERRAAMACIGMMSTETKSPFIGREQVQTIDVHLKDTIPTVVQAPSPTDPTNVRFIDHRIPPDKWMVVNSVTSLASTMHHGIIKKHQSGNDSYHCIYREKSAPSSHTSNDHCVQGQVDSFKPPN
jgi:hypothetical protein